MLNTIHSVNHFPIQNRAHVTPRIDPKSAKTAKIINNMAHAIKMAPMAAKPLSRADDTEKKYSDRFYDQYVPFQEVVDLGLENRSDEAHIPLMNLVKNEMGLDIENVVLKDLHKLVKKLYPHKSHQEIQGIIDNAQRLAGRDPKKLLKKIIEEKIVRDQGTYNSLVKRYNRQKRKTYVSKNDAMKLAQEAGKILPLEQYNKILSEFIGKNVSRLSESKLRAELGKIQSGKRWLILAQSLLKGFDKEPSIGLKKYFNTANDAYGKLVLDEYLSNPTRKAELSEKIQQWTARQVAFEIRDILDKKYGIFRERYLNSFEESLYECLLKKDTPEFVPALTYLTENEMVLSPSDTQTTFTDLLMTQFKGERVGKIFNPQTLSDEEFVGEVKSRLNNLLMEKLKETQSHYIHQYDGLIEHYAPATIRGLHDVDDDVVKNLAVEGDYSSVYDIFNNEVSSGARKSLYALGHTGASNRSTTLNFNIASYFATAHGLKSGTPESVWFMIYEPQEALYMSEIESAGAWKEAEVVMPHLGAKKFLGAVKFVVDKSKTNSKNIVLKPVDGFLSDKAKSGEFDKAGMVGELKQVFDYAQHFEKRVEGSPGILKVKRHPKDPKSTMSRVEKIAQHNLIQQFVEGISRYPNEFVHQVLPKKDLPANQAEYLAERAKQRAFVDREDDQRRLERLQKEREKHLALSENYWDKHNVTWIN